jgi:D-alanine-D-alanine ligase
MLARDPRELPALLLHNLDPQWSADDLLVAQRDVELLANGLRCCGHEVETVAVTTADLAAVLAPYHPQQWVVLNWCEDLPGQRCGDVATAAFLESAGFTFTGASSRALALAWNKPRVKRRLERAGVATPAWRLMDGETTWWRKFPAIVKPANEHCSVGLTRDSVVLNSQELRQRVAWVVETFHQCALVEDFIDGPEYHVSLWGNGHIAPLPPAEMDFSGCHHVRERLCTWDAKFSPGSADFEQIQVRLPAPLSAGAAAQLVATAKAAYACLPCRDIARIDIRERDGVFYVLDVNPNPDLSPDTSTVLAAELEGLSYGALGSRLLALAADRRPLPATPVRPRT